MSEVPRLRVDRSDSGTRLQEGRQGSLSEWKGKGGQEDDGIRHTFTLRVGSAVCWRAELLLEGDAAAADQSEVADFFLPGKRFG